jgi:DNA-directed RNA polymerase specialized sigma24 family protein
MGFSDLLAAARSGNRASLERLFAPWQSLLRLQADQSLGGELSARVSPSDLVQEACAQAFADLAEFRGTTEGERVNWLRSMVVGRAANARRHHHAARRSLAREQVAEADGPPSPAPGPAEAAVIREQDARLARALDALPGDIRLVILRQVFLREPFDAVARALDRSPAAARVLWTGRCAACATC